MKKQQGRDNRNRKRICGNDLLQFKGKTVYSPTTDSESEKWAYQYQEDELVWAKIVGYPWWPGVVCQKTRVLRSSEQSSEFVLWEFEYKIQFLGDGSIAWMDKQKLAQYSVNRQLFVSQAKRSKKVFNNEHFKIALKQADEIVESLNEMPTMAHLDKLSERHSQSQEMSMILEKTPAKSISKRKLLRLYNLTEGKIKKPKEIKAKKGQKSKRRLEKRDFKKQIALLLCKIFRRSASNESDTILKNTALMLSKKFCSNSEKASLPYMAQRFMKFYTQVKSKTFEEVKDQVSSFIDDKNTVNQLNQPIEDKTEVKINSLGQSVSQPIAPTFVFIDQNGKKQMCFDALTEVDIEISVSSL